MQDDGVVSVASMGAAAYYEVIEEAFAEPFVDEIRMSDPRSDEKFLYDEILMMLDDGM